MEEQFKETVLEIAALVKEFPEALQSRVLDFLLTHEVGDTAPKAKRTPANPPKTESEEPGQPAKTGSNHSDSESEIVGSDLHVKMRKFLEKYDISLEQLNDLFYKEADEFKPLYEDLKTTKTSESQIRIAILLALNKALTTGDFEFSGEAVRKECVARKCYDMGNFSKYFNNAAGLFDGFSSYDKTNDTIRLGEEGKKKLSALIKELQ